jgi:D-alanyl-D-alanine carboxypeptidase
MKKAVRLRNLLVSLSVASAVLFGFVTPASADPGSAATVAGNARLQALLDELVANGASGALARVDDGRHTWTLASGAARLEPRQRLLPQARFRIGSVTKSFVATLTLQLVGEGRLRLDDTVARWLPGLVPNGNGITLRMLLNHTSGLFDYTEDPAFFERLIHNPTSPLPPRRLVAIATSHSPTFAPGAGWSYSNTGYIVAGLMIEAATGRRVERLVRDRIIRPLGLTHTSFPMSNIDITGYHAHGYLPPSLSGDGFVDVTPFAPSLAWTAGAIISTSNDLSRFYAALLAGRLLRPALLTQMLTTVPVSPVNGYALGIYTQRGPCGTVWGHDGGINGYITFAYNDRSGRRSAVLMLPTQPDNALGSLFMLTVDTAVCQMFGRVPPASSAAAHPSITPLERLLR